MMTSFLRSLLRHRVAATLAIAASVLVSLVVARNIGVRFQYSDFYEYPGSSGVPLLRQHYAEFGDPAGYVILLVESNDVFTPETLRYVDRLSRALAPEHEFSEILSLSTARVPRAI